MKKKENKKKNILVLIYKCMPEKQANKFYALFHLHFEHIPRRHFDGIL